MGVSLHKCTSWASACCAYASWGILLQSGLVEQGIPVPVPSQVPWQSSEVKSLVHSHHTLVPAQEQDNESARMERGDDIELEKKKHHRLLGIRRKLIRSLLLPLLCLLFAAAAVTVYYLKYTLVRLAGLQHGGHEGNLSSHCDA